MSNPEIATFSIADFESICANLAVIDADLATILDAYGYPPLWSRPNSYETLVWIILEQQVSLASAKASLEKLRAKVVSITPENAVLLSDEEFRKATVSRQKATYIRHLSEQIIDKSLDVAALEKLSNDEIRNKLIKLKGIGNWTVDVYLILVLHRSDFFPLGDLAAVNVLKALKALPKDTPPEVLLKITMPWMPYRSVGTMLLWHYYLSVRSRTLG